MRFSTSAMIVTFPAAYLAKRVSKSSVELSDWI
jgi:hypothetical protein